MRMLAVQLAVRSLRRDATYVLTCAITTTLAIALNGGLYGLVHDAVFAPEPFPQAARTYVIGPSTPNASVSEPLDRRALAELRARVRLLTSVGGYAPARVVTAAGDRSQDLAAVYVTPDLLPALGVTPAHGRFALTTVDAPEVLVSATVAAREHWDVGAVLRLRSLEVRIAGIMPEGFQFPARQDLWIPDALRPLLGDATDSSLWVLGVARPGVSSDAIAREVAALSASVARDAASSRLHAIAYRVQLVPADTRRLALLLLATGLALALVATANIAGLTAAREVTSQRERSVQRALGASEWDIAAELLASLAVVTAPAVLIGGGIAHALLEVVRARYALNFPYWVSFSLDARGAITGVGLAILMIVGAVALVMRQGRRGELAAQLRDAPRGAQAGHASGWQRRIVVFAQVTIAVAVVVVTGRLVQSARAYVEQSPGFSSDGLLVTRIDPPTTQLASSDEQRLALEAVRDRVRALPGVWNATIASSVPAAGTADYAAVPPAAGAPTAEQRQVVVSAGDERFFPSLGVKPLAGRTLRADDRVRAGRMNAVVNRTFVRQFFGRGEPLAAAVPVVIGPDTLTASVVGVVPDIVDQVISVPVEPAIYVPLDASRSGTRYLVVRCRPGTSFSATLLAATVRRELPGATLGRIAPLHVLREELYAQESLLAALATVLAIAAGLLAVIGVHALLRLTVEHERPDAALRLALGAEPHRLGRRLVSHLLVPGGMAIVTGLVIAIGASGALRFALFGSAAHGNAAYVWTVMAALVLVIGEGVLGWWRLARTNPNDVLR